MKFTFPLKKLWLFLLILSILITPVQAFILGTTEDLDEFNSYPENTEPISEENFSPVAQNSSYETYRNIAFRGDFAGVDPENDSLIFRVIKHPARGSISISEENPKQFIYTPYENKCGKDKFTYIAEDSFGNVSKPATVKIKIQKNKSKVHYVDMDDNLAHRDAIRLAEEDIFVGYQLAGNYFFEPDKTISRAEFLTLTMNALNVDLLDDATSSGFYDEEPIETWAMPYIATALYTDSIMGSFSAEGKATFEAQRPITYSEAGVMLNRLLKLSDVSSNSKNKNESTPAWALQSFSNLEAVGVLNIAEVQPTAYLTKAETATLLASALDVIEFREKSNWFNFFS